MLGLSFFPFLFYHLQAAPPIVHPQVIQLDKAQHFRFEGFGLVSTEPEQEPLDFDNSKEILYMAPPGRKLRLSIVRASDGVCNDSCTNGGLKVHLTGEEKLICCPTWNTGKAFETSENLLAVARQASPHHFKGPWNLEYYVELLE
ncbi:unnamed protein product, partial [Mesorhabditis spiculigera]